MSVFCEEMKINIRKDMNLNGAVSTYTFFSFFFKYYHTSPDDDPAANQRHHHSEISLRSCPNPAAGRLQRV